MVEVKVEPTQAKRGEEAQDDRRKEKPRNSSKEGVHNGGALNMGKKKNKTLIFAC